MGGVIVTAEAVALAVGFSVVGIFFGVWLARQAVLPIRSRLCGTSEPVGGGTGDWLPPAYGT
jgi:hypothetical protein